MSVSTYQTTLCCIPDNNYLHTSTRIKFPGNDPLTKPPVHRLCSPPVVKFSPDAALEEPTAAVAREDAVVLPRARVPTHDTRQSQRRFVLGGGWRRRRARHVYVSVSGPQQEGVWGRRGSAMCRRRALGPQAQCQGMRTRRRWRVTLPLWDWRWHNL